MDERPRERGLIPNRLVGVIGVVLTGLVAALSIRDAFFRPVRHHDWLLLGWWGPKWLTLSVNAVFYGYLLWACFLFFRVAKGRERVVVVGWSLGIVLDPVKHLVSMPAVAVIQYVEAAAMAVALLAALDILLKLPAPDKAQT